MSAVQDFMSAQERILRRFGVEAESLFLDVATVTGPVHILTSGNGPPLVMVPGLGDPTAMWSPLMAELEGFSLFAVDRPCFGLTGQARHTTATIRTLGVQFLEQVLDGLGLERPVFVANSMGSLWSFWLALDRPNRVAAVTHVGCPAFLLGTSALLPLRLLSVRPLGRLLMRLTPPSPRQVEGFAAMAGEDLSAQPELVDLLVAAQRLPGAQTAILELLHAVVRLRGPRPGLPLTAEQLAQVTQPTQLIWGERDPFGTPEVGREAARIIPHAEFHLITGAGHVPWVLQAERVGELAQAFLRDKV